MITFLGLPYDSLDSLARLTEHCHYARQGLSLLATARDVMVWIDCVSVYTHLYVYTSEVQMSTWCTELG